MELINRSEIDYINAPIAPVLKGDKVHYEYVAFRKQIEELPTIPSIPLETAEKIRQEIEEINPVEYGDTYDYEIHTGIKYCKEDVAK